MQTTTTINSDTKHRCTRLNSGSISKLSRYVKELGHRSLNLPSRLLVFYVFVGNACFTIAYDTISSYLLTVPTMNDRCYSVSVEKSVIPFSAMFTLVNSLIFWLYPLTGWIADTIIGRNRAILYSLWSCWVGILLQCIAYCAQYPYTRCEVSIVAEYVLPGVAFIFLSVGSAGFYTVLPAYGVDQLSDKPSCSVRAFIHWVVFGIFASSLIDIGLNQPDPVATLIVYFFIFVCASVSLCLHGWLCVKFEMVGTQLKNPYKTVIGVLKYAYSHKSPERRSAMTYWEDKIPSRIDLGKSKYGGPFQEEDVENVKTLWKMVCVILSMFGFYIPYYTTVYNAGTFATRYEGDTAGNVLWSSFDSTILVIIPLLELVIIPCWPKVEYFLLSPLKGIGFTYILNILTLSIMTVIEALKNYHPNINTFWLFCVPFFFSGLVHAFSFIYGLEFICSQAPTSMSGMLLGIFWLVHAMYVIIGYFFFQWKQLDSQWIFLLLLFVCAVGFVVFIVTGRWYRRGNNSDFYHIYGNISSVYNREYERLKDQDSISVLSQQHEK